jgi:4-carboxymuconolactone decarboxylase
LSTKETRLIDLALAVTLRDATHLRALRLSAPEGEPDREWREALLQLHLFAGFPSVVEALRVLQQAGGLGQPGAAEAKWESDDFERGGELFAAIYGDNEAAVREQIAAGHPLFERWVLGHAYGRVLARDGLTPRMRELLAVACLSAQGLERQLASHVRGALALGASPEDVRETLACLAGRIDADRLARAHSVAERFVR